MPERESAVARTRSEKRCLPNPSEATARPRSAGHRPSAPAVATTHAAAVAYPAAEPKTDPHASVGPSRRSPRPRRPRTSSVTRVRPASRTPARTGPSGRVGPPATTASAGTPGVHRLPVTAGWPARPGPVTTARIARIVPIGLPAASALSATSPCASSAGISPSVSSAGTNRHVSNAGSPVSSVAAERTERDNPSVTSAGIDRNDSSVRIGPSASSARTGRRRSSGIGPNASSG